MSDRTYASAQFYGPRTEAQTKQINETLDEWNLPELDEDDHSDALDIRCGVVGEIVDDLAAIGVPFEISEDPAYEWLGEVARYHPALGIWRNEAAAEGRPVYTADTMRELVAQVIAAPEADRQALLDAATGKAWSDLATKETNQ